MLKKSATEPQLLGFFSMFCMHACMSHLFAPLTNLVNDHITKLHDLTLHVPSRGDQSPLFARFWKPTVQVSPNYLWISYTWKHLLCEWALEEVSESSSPFLTGKDPYQRRDTRWLPRQKYQESWGQHKIDLRSPSCLWEARLGYPLSSKTDQADIWAAQQPFEETQEEKDSV